MRIASSLVLICLTAGAAAADSKIDVLDRGDAVEVIAHDMKALKTDIATVRSRLEIPVAGTSATPGTTSKAMPASVKVSASSPPRPKTNGSPPLRRTTLRPSRARSTIRASVSCCSIAFEPGALPT